MMQIEKRPGKFRMVYCPEPEEKRRLRALVPQLNLLAEELDVHHVCHGFTEGRSPVTNATVHIGYEFTVSFDLENFFDTVTRSMFRPMCDTHAGGMILMHNGKSIVDISSCFVGGPFTGFCGQGLPTSPALANIAFSPADREIMALCPKGRFHEKPFVYTRYADDLTFSCRTMATVELLLQEIPRIVVKHGFKLNEAKTKVQCAKAGRRIITGVAVGEKDITIPRGVRRRIRAAHHQDEHGLRQRNIRRILRNRRYWKKRRPIRFRFYHQMKGLIEWAKLKAPKEVAQPKNKMIAAAARVVTAVCGQSISNKVFGSWSRRFG